MLLAREHYIVDERFHAIMVITDARKQGVQRPDRSTRPCSINDLSLTMPKTVYMFAPLRTYLWSGSKRTKPNQTQ